MVNLYLTGEISYQSLVNEPKTHNPATITRLVINFRDKGIVELKSKKRGIPSKMSKKAQVEKKLKKNKMN